MCDLFMIFIDVSALDIVSIAATYILCTHCKKFKTLINNSWPILQTSVTFPAHASIEMYGIMFIFQQVTKNILYAKVGGI